MNNNCLALMRATPGNDRLHTVDARVAALAFVHAAERRDAVAGEVVSIGVGHTHVHTHRDVENDIKAALGLRRLGHAGSLPGHLNDEDGWSFISWFATAGSQALLAYQQHDWRATVGWIAQYRARLRPVLHTPGPLLRLLLRRTLDEQRRGRYADPWTLIEKVNGLGPHADGTSGQAGVER